MKSLKSLVLTSVFAAGLAGSASANTTAYIHIVGAPAYRQNSNDSISAVVATFASAGLTATSATSTTASAIESAKQNQWKIPNFSSGVDLIINASYTGSTAGFESVASAGTGGVTQKFIADGTGTVASPTVGASASSVITPDNTWVTLSDTFQGTTIFNGSVTLYGGAGNTLPFTHNYQTLNATPLGVEPYRFVVSPGAPASFTNINAVQAQALFASGSLPLSFFTGNNADEGTTVYALSRDGGSGSRLIALNETGYETAGIQVAIATYKPTVTGGTLDSENSRVGGTIASGTPPVYPVGVVPSTGIYDGSAGDVGYPSFGTTDQTGLLLAVTSSHPSNELFVTYLNVDDSNEASAAGAKILSYNGVTYSTSAVAEGNYTFWSYEQLFAPATQSSAAASFSTLLANEFPTYAEVPLSALNVSRSVDGGPISQNF
jgi:hypothetical protein